MTFGLCNAPATFQTFMNDIFEDLLDQGHVVFTLMISSSFMIPFSTLRDLTHTVLQRLGKFDLYLKPEKCSFDKTSIEYLGVIIADGQVRMDPAKVAGITQWPVPTNGQRTQAFLGSATFYRRFYCKLLCHCTPSLRLNLERHCLSNGPLHIKLRLPTLISQFYPSPCPCLPDHTQPFSSSRTPVISPLALF